MTESRSYFAATPTYDITGPAVPTDYYDATTYSYAWWNTSTSTDPLYITLKQVSATLPTVNATTHNGSGSTTDASVSYLRKDGRAAIVVAPDGVYTAMKYNNLGLPLRTVRDADPSVSGDFDSGYGPGNFGLSTSSNSGLKYASEATYDAVGRTVTTTAHAGSSPCVSYTHYGQLTDHRLTAVSVAALHATPSWTGPFSYSVSNQGGRGEFSATLGPPLRAVTTSPSSWITTSSDPIDALYSTLSGTNRAYVQNVATTIYDTPGVKPVQSRKYIALIPERHLDRYRRHPLRPD